MKRPARLDAFVTCRTTFTRRQIRWEVLVNDGSGASQSLWTLTGTAQDYDRYNAAQMTYATIERQRLKTS